MPRIVDPPNTEAQPLRDTGATLLTLGGLAAAFGAASCCALPLLLASFGIGSAWLTGIALLAAPERPLLLGAAAICLAAATALLGWRWQTAGTCTPGAVCSRPLVRALTVAGLVVGAALATVGYLYA